MWRFAAALPFFNFAGRDFRGDDREAERFERRAVFLRRLLPEREARFLRRLVPPAGQGIDPGQPVIQFSMQRLLLGRWRGAHPVYLAAAEFLIASGLGAQLFFDAARVLLLEPVGLRFVGARATRAHGFAGGAD
jgi:hypothetical protein